MLAPLRAPDGRAGGALRLRLRLRRSPAGPPAESPPLPQLASPLDAPPPGDADMPFASAGAGLGGAGGSYASWMSALAEMSASFSEREGLPEDPEHPAGTGPQPLASLPRWAAARAAGASAAAAAGLLPPAPADVWRDASFEAGGALSALPPAAPPFLGGGARAEELREEQDAPDADGEDERSDYYLSDLTQRQDYGPEAEDPYAMASEEERE